LERCYLRRRRASDGYFQKTKLGLEATIRAGRFKMWFKDPRQPAIVLRWLYAKSALSTKGTPPTKPGTGIVWAESQPLWPGWNGIDQKRIIASLTAEELKYTNPAPSVGGTAELAWKRVK